MRTRSDYRLEHLGPVPKPPEEINRALAKYLVGKMSGRELSQLIRQWQERESKRPANVEDAETVHTERAPFVPRLVQDQRESAKAATPLKPNRNPA